jgi:hypothetical protein
LEPVLNEAASQPDPEKAILDLKICDPACGSGHFLISAGHRIAKKLASVRIGDNEPSTEDVRKALRDVIERCLYGVDINPMTVELCKVSLWMEAVVPGKPLSFLEHHIREGNSLLGTTPGLLRRGIPDEAFEPIEGDDKAVCRDYRKRNKSQRLGQEEMFNAFDGNPWERQGNLAATMRNVDHMPDETMDQIRAKERAYQETIRGGSYASNRLLADAWCAAFVWKKSKENHPEGFLEPITQATFQLLAENPHKVPEASRREIRRLSEQYKFFHWHLAFSDVFSLPDRIPDDDLKGWTGGFDVVLGNPPWERLKLQEQEWFSEKRPEIASATNASVRKKAIQALRDDEPALINEFIEAQRYAEGEAHFLRASGKYPFCGVGRDINSSSVFTELMLLLATTSGRTGCLDPTALVTDNTAKDFVKHLSLGSQILSILDFENRAGLFQGVHRSYKFCLLTLLAKSSVVQIGADLVFFALSVDEVSDPSKHFSLSAADVAMMNPNTMTFPVFRHGRDAELARVAYSRFPILKREGGRETVDNWHLQTRPGLFHMSNHASLFKTAGIFSAMPRDLPDNHRINEEGLHLPLYEAKMFHQYDHRWSSYNGTASKDVSPESKQNPELLAQPRYWVASHEVVSRLSEGSKYVLVLQR